MTTFEDLKLAWDSQAPEQTITINPKALHASVQQQADAMNKEVSYMEVMNICAGLFLAAIFGLDLLVHSVINPSNNLSEPVINVILIAVCLGFGLHAWRGRRHRHKHRNHFDQTLKNNAERASQQINWYIKHAKYLIAYYLIPLAIMSVVILIFFKSQYNQLIWLGTLAMCVFAIWSIRQDIRQRLTPQKKNMIYLLNQLNTE